MATNILLIDDDVLVAKSLGNLLTRKGYLVTQVHNAIDAISQVAVRDFDLVISDIRMPGENGIIAVRKIQKVYSEREVICGYIFISGYAEEDTPAHAIQLGVNRFLFKPFDNEQLLSAIAEELEFVHKAKDLRAGLYALRPPLKKAPLKKIPGRRVVITGIGCVAPNGIGKEAYWKGLREGKNCIRRIQSFDPSKFPSQMAAEILDFKATDFIPDTGELKRMARSSQLAVAAAKLAISDGKFRPEDQKNLSVILGSSTSGVEYLLPEAYAFERGGLTKVRPYAGIAGFVGSISSEVSRALGAHGLSHTVSDGCTSANDAMGHALRLIQHGYLDIAMSGGADACVCDGILAAFCRMGAISTRNDEKASRPFNKDRDGFVIAEGAWLFVMEELEHALARKAVIYAEVVGYGASCDAWHMAHPYPSGDFTVKAIKDALEDAQISPEEIDLFESYGNATRINDSFETGVVKRVFGKHAYQLAMPSVKSMLGHAIGAAGAAQTAAALLALKEGFIHPTINYEVPDPECDLDCVPNQGRVANIRAAISNSIAFGGKNSCMVIRSYKG